MPGAMSQPASHREESAVERARARLRASGMRWTPQRRLLVEVLLSAHGHVTGSELVERCRAVDPDTTPSTVYRSLDALEELGLVRHSHGHDGVEEYHVLPESVHGHLRCEACGGTWDIGEAEAAALTEALTAARGFTVNLSHLTVVGRCSQCSRVVAAAELDLADAGT